ncbi:hypothetical protein A9Q87_12160 [Flavobacteriales bacterium 34_180_T64]|nr:hypothetical protein A9Q87_12160 [Flavobacteriales bacterium 34_180_T64]
MQFKHPELLYALLLLIIPILIHLFQLRRFQKVAFTNVKFLKAITLQTRKSSQLKKWLTLLTRLLLFAAIIIAFAQPFISNSVNFNAKSETVIYLDNSFSMQTKGVNGTLLNNAIQNLIESLDESEIITVLTNSTTFPNTSLKAIKNELIKLEYAPSQVDYESLILKSKKWFSKDSTAAKNLVLISDFQQKKNSLKIPQDFGISTKLVQQKPVNTNNINIDSVYVSKSDIESITLTVTINNQGSAIEILPVSLFNDDVLVAKSSVNLETEASVNFTLPINQFINGKITIDDPNLQYDNSLYFNFNKHAKIKVLSINAASDEFLKKIYTEDEFAYQSYNYNTLDYNNLEAQNLIILNELIDIPNSLIVALKAFSNNGGYVLIIPSNKPELNSYNQLFTNYSLSKLDSVINTEKRITEINFSHPLLAGVFDKKISNFQYPKVNSFSASNNLESSILKYEDGSSFLSQSENLFVFTAAINDINSNFKNSPLIVPVIYNIGKQSLKLSQLYYIIGEEHKIDINTTLLQDDILTLGNENQTVIPLQQTFSNKVELTTNEYPNTAGIIGVLNKKTHLANLSFNYGRDESILSYMDLTAIDDATVSETIASAINEIKSTTNINELWKWFVIFALVFLVIEMLILKFLK